MPKRAASTGGRKTKKAKMTKYDDSDPKPTSDVNLNKHITDELENILAGYRREGADIFKIRGLVKAIAEIKTWGVEIRSEEDADMAARIKGVGKGTITQLKEIVTHGSSLKAAEAEAGKTDRERAMEELGSLEGVGSKTAERLVDNNISGLKDLRAAIRSSSVVLKDCKVPDAGLRHAPWAEETTIPATRKEMEAIRDDIAAVAKDFGFTSAELAGAHARGEATATRVELMLVADGWTFEHRVDKLAAKTKTAARAYSKSKMPDDGTPNLEGLVNELIRRKVAQSWIRLAPHAAAVVVVPGVSAAVEPAGELADSGRRVDASGNIKEEAKAAAPDEAEAEAEPKDTSMASSAAVKRAPSAPKAAAKFASMLPDLDDAEEEDEAATSKAAVWDKGQLAAAASATATSSSSSSSQAVAKSLSEAAGEDDPKSREELLELAAKERGRLTDMAQAAIRASGRSPPFATIVRLSAVPGAYAPSARVIMSFSAESLTGIRARAARNGYSVSSIGLTPLVPDPEGKKKGVLGEASETVEDEDEFWERIGVKKVPLMARG